MPTNKRPTIKSGPASNHQSEGELIREFSDGRSGGLLSMRRNNVTGELVVEVYNADPDVTVRGTPATVPDPIPAAGYHAAEVTGVLVPDTHPAGVAVHYRIKVTNGIGGETKWLSVPAHVVRELRDILTTIPE